MTSTSGSAIEFVDRPDLQWTFVDTSATSIENKTICKFEFCTLRWVQPGPGLEPSARQYPVARLAMSVSAMVELHKKLTHMLEKLEAEGVVSRSQPTAAAKAHIIN
jgi:hypothetical protein